MLKTKIEWCDSTWNPVTGCRNGCEYCYARRIAERFSPYDLPRLTGAGILKGINVLDTPIITACRDGKDRICAYPYGFEPTLHRYRLIQPQKWHEPKTIFVCSMADLFGDWVPDGWINEVFEACEKAPQHRYLFLTKNPERYCKNTYGYGVPLGENMWYGTSVTKKGDIHRFNNLPAFGNQFVSMEPLLEDLEPETCNIMFRQVGWFIIGAETGNRSGKVVPERKWIDDIVDMCRKYGKPVFMKDSLIPIMGEENMLREFPWRQEEAKA